MRWLGRTASASERSSSPFPSGRGAGGVGLARVSSHAVGAITSAVPASATAFTDRSNTAAHIASTNTICVSPTTDTFAGAPRPNASVRNTCPTVADTPMPSSDSSTSGSSTRPTGSARGVNRNAAPQNTVATTEK